MVFLRFIIVNLVNRYLLTSCAALLMFGLLASGCAIKEDYEWAKYSVHPGRISGISDFAAGSNVHIINRNPETPKIDLGSYMGSYGQLTQAIVTQYTSELEKKGMTVHSNATKSLELEVTSHNIASSATRDYLNPNSPNYLAVEFRTNLTLQIDMGNGYSKEMEVSDTRGLNGVIAIAVTELLNDRDVSAYLRN